MQWLQEIMIQSKRWCDHFKAIQTMWNQVGIYYNIETNYWVDSCHAFYWWRDAASCDGISNLMMVNYLWYLFGLNFIELNLWLLVILDDDWWLIKTIIDLGHPDWLSWGCQKLIDKLMLDDYYWYSLHLELTRDKIVMSGSLG